MLVAMITAGYDVTTGLSRTRQHRTKEPAIPYDRAGDHSTSSEPSLTPSNRKVDR